MDDPRHDSATPHDADANIVTGPTGPAEGPGLGWVVRRCAHWHCRPLIHIDVTDSSRTTPHHASWLNQAELFFSILTRRVLRRGEFTSQQDLTDPIEKFVAVYNRIAKPFRWAYDGRPLKAT